MSGAIAVAAGDSLRLHHQAAAETLAAIQSIHRLGALAALGDEARLHYLRCIRLNLTATEDRVAGDDDMPPVVAARLSDVMHDIHRSATEIDA